MQKIKKILKRIIQKVVGLTFPNVRVNSNYSYKILGKDDCHYFVGYYDKDPVNRLKKEILCHQVSLKYSNLVEPISAKIGLISIEDNSFQELTNTNARQQMYVEQQNLIEQDMAPFGFLDDGINEHEQTTVDEYGDVWSPIDIRKGM